MIFPFKRHPHQRHQEDTSPRVPIETANPRRPNTRLVSLFFLLEPPAESLMGLTGLPSWAHPCTFSFAYSCKLLSVDGSADTMQLRQATRSSRTLSVQHELPPHASMSWLKGVHFASHCDGMSGALEDCLANNGALAV